MKKSHAQRRCIAVLGIVVAGVFLLCCPDALALDPALDVSQYAHTAWKVRDGFFKSGIGSIAQTPDGYLWLGTDFGLLRFDGVRAVPWQPANQPLPSSEIFSLVAARDGTLWIGTAKGLASWKDGKLTLYPEVAGQYIFRVLEDREGSIWVGAAGVPAGKFCVIHSGSVQCFGEDGSLGLGVLGLYEDRKGQLWAGVRNGLWRWKPGPPQFYSMPGETGSIQGLAEDEDGALLVGTREGIKRLIDGKFQTYPLPGMKKKFQANRLFRDRDGGLWIGTVGQGLVHVHQGRTDVFLPTDGLSGENVQYLFEDQEGTIWVASANGLDRFREFAVSTFSVSPGSSNNNVWSALADRDGSVWFATLDGLKRWDNGQTTIARTGSGKRDGKLHGQSPISLFQDSRGRMWVSTVREFGYLENDQFISVGGVPGGVVRAVAEDAAGNLWLAYQDHGVFQLHGRTPVQQIPWARLGHKDFAAALAADRAQGGLWLGFFNGGVAYFKDGQVRASYATADGLGEGVVNSLQVDQDDTLWATTPGGLSRLKNGRVATLSSKNGLPCDAINWVMEDDYHALWLYTACGLVRIAQPELDAWIAAVDNDKNAKPTIQNAVFDTTDGVRSFASVRGGSPVVTKTADGKLWFLPGDGVSVVDPRHLPLNKLPPPVHIEQVIADRKTYEVTSNASGSMPLPALTRDLRIDYTALSLVAAEKVMFRYELEGWDRDWQDVGTRRQAFYSNLPPRKYRFRVKACNNSGLWNEAGTYLDFAVAPAYYQTLWFRLSCLVAFLALLAGLHRLRLRQLAQQFNRTMEARVGERTRIAQDLHDSLLQGVQGLMFRLQAVRDMLPGRAPAEAIEALDIALERGDKAIAEGRDTVSDLRQSVMEDSDIGQALTALGEELAAQSDNDAKSCVRVLVEGEQRELNPLLRDEVYRIAREALRNAFRHAKAQKIEAEITYGDSEFLLHVRDDGSGIDPAIGNQGARAGHWGLPGMRERAKRFGGKLEVWSEQGAGTEIELSVPATVAYGKPDARSRFWFLRRKTEQTDRQQP